jgi:leader peptidase (prepilin peptidase)/N-methyltransferase
MPLDAFDLYFNIPPGSLSAALVAGLFGLLIGSFLNVVIHRVPKMMQRESDN